MVETASREKWTDRKLDDLNHALKGKLHEFAEDTREVRADLQRLTAEVNMEFDHFKAVHSASARFLGRRSIERQSPEAGTTGLTRGQAWTEERIADLHLALSTGVTGLDGDIHELRGEAMALRVGLTTRFADLERVRRPWRGSHPRVIHQRYPSRLPMAAVASPANGPWTDGRLDDFNHRGGEEFAGLACDIREIKSEVANLQNEMTERFRALRKARDRTQDRWIMAVALSPIPLAILLNAVLIAIRVR